MVAVPSSIERAVVNMKRIQKESSVVRKPPAVTETHPQAYSTELSRMQKLYLLLHFRFGHASLKRLKQLTPFAKILTRAHKVECPVCLAAKATKRPHIGRLVRMHYALALVSFDIQGSFRVEDVDKNRYNLVLVDDHTDYKWLYRLRTKDQLGATLRLWMAMLGVSPERLRHDGTGENLGDNGINSVTQICYERCIYPERTVPYNPQQLTRCERVNRTFLECARCLMLTTPGATDDLWGYAFMHACYLDQFLASETLEGCSYSRWFGHQPSQELLNSIRTWGSIVVFTHNEDRHKLQMPGHQGMFLGYSTVCDGVFIRDLDNVNKPVRITRDVLSRSYSEVQHLVREPVGVTFDEYALLKDEPSGHVTSEHVDASWESILLTNCQSVDKELQAYYKSFQSFAKDRRQFLLQEASRSPSEIEATIKADWRKLQLEHAHSQRAHRQAEQVVARAQDLIEDTLHRPAIMSEQVQPSIVDTSDVSSKLVSRQQETAQRRSKRLAADSSNVTQQPPFKVPRTSEPTKVPAQSASQQNLPTPVSATPAASVSRSGKFDDTDVSSIACEHCGDHNPQHKSPMIICDGCNRGFHMKCAKISVMPHQDHDWLCHSCLQPGMRISVFMRRNKQWQDGTVRTQLPPGMGTEVIYDDGARAIENLYSEQWKPLYDNTFAHVMSLLQHDAPSDVRNISVWMATNPRSLAHLKRFPQYVQDLWRESRLKEFKSIVAKQAVEIIDKSQLPPNAIVIPGAWIFKIKGDGTFKSRLILLGHLMPKDDEIDVSSPTPRLATIRFILAVAIKLGLAVEIVDIDTAFTYASPHTTIYASIPGGLYSDGRLDGKYMHLLKNLYGADTAPRMFHNLLHNWFVADGFDINEHEPCLYIKWYESTPLFVCVHVDDCIVISSQALVDDFKERIQKIFSIKELGPLGLAKDGSPSLLLGMEIIRTDDEFQVKQTKLIDALIEKAGNELHNVPLEKVPMRDLRLDSSSSPTTESEKMKWKLRPYRSYLGVIGYIMLASRNECSFGYQVLARFNDTYGQDHWSALLAMIAYLKKTRDTHFLVISKHGGMAFSAYCDSDWNGSACCKSSTGWIIFWGWVPISWVSRLQRVTARSTGEAEFIALSSLAQEAVFLQMFAKSMHVPPCAFEIFSNDKSRYQAGSAQPAAAFDTAVKIWSDSKVALAQASKPDHWVVDKLRHIRTAFFFFKSYVRSAQLQLCSVSGNDNPADIFTKGFGAPGKTAANQKSEVFQRHAAFCAGRR